MKKLIDVLRRAPIPGSEPYHQVFAYETDDETATVATALRELNAREELVDVNGDVANAVSWECSCLQKKCGACAMVIEGRPRAACDTKLSDVKGDTVHLEPLRKFPVVTDLVVDRASIFDRLRNLEVWLQGSVELPTKRSGVAYEASRCLECGCCLEACPNFSVDSTFGGMATMVPLARLLAETTGDEKRALADVHKTAVVAGCGKSLACRNVCPAGIDIANLMSRSNAASLWHRS